MEGIWLGAIEKIFETQRNRVSRRKQGLPLIRSNRDRFARMTLTGVAERRDGEKPTKRLDKTAAIRL
jgi:hypothetical protein